MAKPIKKSDLKKSWICEHRDRKILIAPEYHLIVTEVKRLNLYILKGLKMKSIDSTRIEYLYRLKVLEKEIIL